MRKSMLFFAILVIFSSACIQNHGQFSAGESETVFVEFIIDGDTIVVSSKNKVRLIGINAPENGAPCFEEAKEKLRELLQDREIEMKKDISETDKYGRLLRYVYLEDLFINKFLVARGLARAVEYEPDTLFYEELKIAEQEAMENNIGCLWEK